MSLPAETIGRGLITKFMVSLLTQLPVPYMYGRAKVSATVTEKFPDKTPSTFISSTLKYSAVELLANFILNSNVVPFKEL